MPLNESLFPRLFSTAVYNLDKFGENGEFCPEANPRE